MNLRDWLTRKNLIIAAVVFALLVATACYFALRRPQPVAMERYVAASSLAYLEVNNLADVVDGLTNTQAWRELGPALGLSSQLRQIGLMADLVGRTGLGPEEAVLAGRAQLALALTDVEAQTGQTDEGPYLHFKPRLALVIETHARPATAARLVGERAIIVAQRIYGMGVDQEEQAYQGTRLLVFRGANPDRPLVAAAIGSVIVLTNHLDAMKTTLDTIAGRAPSLAEDATLARLKPDVATGAAVNAFITETGINKLIALVPPLAASRYAAEPETVASFTSLLEHMASQAVAGLLYSAEFKDGGVVDRYLTALKPGIGEALAEALKPAQAAGFKSPQLIPRGAEELTLLNIERAGELPERALKQLAPHVDLVAGLALREFVINLRKQYGIEGGESIGDAVGHEIALVNLGDGGSQAMLISVKDKDRLAPFIARYLSRGDAKVTTENVGGTELRVSSNEDNRAAAFIGSFLVLATRQQINQMMEAQAAGGVIAADERLQTAIGQRPPGAGVVSLKPADRRAGELLLVVSKLTRVTDGSRELLEQERVRQVLDSLPPTVGFTEFRAYGIYSETHSAIGNFGLLAALAGGAEPEK
ncbi:MAG TPA: hypothetical protein VKA60_00945 [Blastocatellia bacterium]|nr:hypothetical protein [Blastocatellia bacterium]